MPSPSAVDVLVAQLERAVVAPSRVRRDVASEIAGDLREAVAARVGAGLSPADAEAAVAAEFGDPRAIAGELSVELLADRGRRFAPYAAIGAGALVAAWFVGMTSLASLPGFVVPAESGWMLSLSRALDAAAPLVAGAAIVGWAVIRRFGSLAALVAVAALQLAFSLTLVIGGIVMATVLPVPAGGEGMLVALMVATVVLGTGLAAAAASMLARWAAVRRALAPARG